MATRSDSEGFVPSPLEGQGVRRKDEKLFPFKLLYVGDKCNKCKYLIDTGAAVSVLPKSCANKISDADCLPLVVANNTTINTYGTSKRVVDVGLKRDYTWNFIVADVQQPIIGADFLIHYSLLVDLRSRCLRDMRTSLAIPASLHKTIRPVPGTDSPYDEGRARQTRHYT